MTALLRAELLKLRTTRTTPGLLLGMLALVVFATILHGLALKTGNLATRADQMKVFGWGALGALFAGLLGAMSITGEIRHGTIRPTFLTTPRRGRVLAAKAEVGMLAGIGFGLVAEAVAIGVAAGALSARGIPIRLDGGDYAQLLLGGAVAAALWAAIGVGLGALLRNQLATVAGLCAWLLLVENLLLGQVPGFGRFLPGSAAAAIGGTTFTGNVRPPLLAALAGLLLLIVYAVAAAGAGVVATSRRDV